LLNNRADQIIGDIWNDIIVVGASTEETFRLLGGCLKGIIGRGMDGR
jgi:hypothetical protein